MVDLIYCNEARTEVLERFPHAKIEDASDDIHDERISVTLPDEEKDVYFKWIIKNGWHGVSLGIQSMLHDNASQPTLDRWLQELKQP